MKDVYPTSDGGGDDGCDGGGPSFDDLATKIRTRRRNQSRRRRRPAEETNHRSSARSSTVFWCQCQTYSALLVALVPLALLFVSSSSSLGKVDPSFFFFLNNNSNGGSYFRAFVEQTFRQQQKQQRRRFLLLEENRGPAVASTHSYSTYVGYHKRTGRPTDSYYAYPTDDADLKVAAAATEGSLKGSSSSSSNGTTKWQQSSPAVAKTVASSAAAAARQRLQYRLTREETDLTDVWFCIGLALVWTVWMLRSFLKSELRRYSQDSIMVRGHVLQVTLEEETSLGTGIPTYKAVIDYMVGDDEASKIQIRKQFETQTHLEQGFANVELLVLHDEPTHSVLKEDWEAQVEELEEQEESIFCLPNKWWKRIWIACCITIILMSLSASVLAVHRLPHTQRSTGWICVCAGVSLLLPTAVSIRMLMTAVQRSLQQGSEAAGVIVQGAVKNYSCDYLDNVMDVTSACDDDKNAGVGAAAGLAAASSTGNRGQHSIVQTPDVDETGCYVIRMPPRGFQRFRSDVSDISAVSQTLAQQFGMNHGNSGVANAGGANNNIGGGSSIDGVAGGGAVIGVSAVTATDQFPRPRLF